MWKIQSEKKHIFLERSLPYKDKLVNCASARQPMGACEFPPPTKKSIGVKHRSLFQASARNYNALTSYFILPRKN